MSEENVKLKEYVEALVKSGKVITTEKFRIPYSYVDIPVGVIVDVNIGEDRYSNKPVLNVGGYSYENEEQYASEHFSLRLEDHEEEILSLRPATEEEVNARKAAIDEFEALVKEAEDAAQRATAKAEELGLDREAIVLSDPSSLIEWYSSRR